MKYPVWIPVCTGMTALCISSSNYETALLARNLLGILPPGDQGVVQGPIAAGVALAVAQLHDAPL